MVGALASAGVYLDMRLTKLGDDKWQRFQAQCAADHIPPEACRSLFWRADFGVEPRGTPAARDTER